MRKSPIAVLDEGIYGINFFNYLANKYKYEELIYINDLSHYPYEGLEEEAINKLVSKKIDLLLSLDVKAIIIISNSIVEYCSDYLNKLKVPVIRIDNAIIDYVNKKFDQKNIVLFGKDSILKSNIYQKNFKYNHLYTVLSDNFEDIIIKKEVKTSKSFNEMKEATKHLANREIDLFLMLEPFLENLYTEINEFIKASTIGNLNEILNKACSNKKIFTNTKKSGKRFIYTDLSKKEFKEKVHWIDMKYKYQTINELKNKLKIVDEAVEEFNIKKESSEE